MSYSSHRYCAIARHDGMIMPVRALRVLQQEREAIASRVEAEVSSVLGAPPAAEALVPAAVHAHASLDEAGRRALSRPGAPAPACGAGCSYCCHVHVDATAPEILAIASHLASTWSREAVSVLRERLAAQVASVEMLDDQARWAEKIPCALLDGAGRCSIYAARPLRCRAFHSCDAAPCREAFNAMPGRALTLPLPEESPPLRRAHDAVEEGYDRALTRASLSALGYRLEMGLLLALEAQRTEATEATAARWLAGEPVFDRALPR